MRVTLGSVEKEIPIPRLVVPGVPGAAEGRAGGNRLLGDAPC
jgi:hypothetical protein